MHKVFKFMPETLKKRTVTLQKHPKRLQTAPVSASVHVSFSVEGDLTSLVCDIYSKTMLLAFRHLKNIIFIDVQLFYSSKSVKVQALKCTHSKKVAL